MIGVYIFLKQAKDINYNQFRLNYEFKNNLYEFINGMIEIKLNVAQTNRLSKLNAVINKLYKENTKYRFLIQKQLLVVKTINLFKNLFITLLCAYWVIEKQLTFGVMLSISFITGYLNNAIESFVDFFRASQDAKLAIERMDEIFKKDDEVKNSTHLNLLSNNKDLIIENVSFKYPGTYSTFVLKNISFALLTGKITAIVGSSGSGKTTLLKLLLAYYLPTEGRITIGNDDLVNINADDWRKKCGTVMQSGYLFSASIEENISLSAEVVDAELLNNACEIACIKDFIISLPNQYKTKIWRIWYRVKWWAKLKDY